MRTRPWWPAGLAVMLGMAVHAAAADLKPPPFFAFCMDTHDAKKRSLPEQAALLKELGYDGAGHLWLDQVAERLRALDVAGLKLFQVYLAVNVSPGAKPATDARLKDVLPLLKGRGTQVALLLQGAKSSDESLDPHVVTLIRDLAAQAATNGVQLLLYPHSGDWVETIQDAVRVADKVDRPNVGVMFNLCHWLRVSKDRDYAPLLKRALPRLGAVSINGADEFDEHPGGGRYVQPLDSGTFDITAFLKTLRELGYRGPIGLQCYGLGGDAREHLARSIAAWRKLNAS